MAGPAPTALLRRIAKNRSTTPRRWTCRESSATPARPVREGGAQRDDGLHLRIWFEQQKVELESDETVRTVARHNDREQFAVYLKPRIEQAIVDRHQANGELFEAYFGSDERRELVDEFLVASLYEAIRAGAA